MKSHRILITAGPTREPMDPVRYLTNPSSGAVGIELAKTLKKKGALVTLVLGPTPLRPPSNVKTIPVITALQMRSAVRKNLPRSDVFISAAAVGDWRFKTAARHKMKKGSSANMRVGLVRNPDILAEAGQAKRKRLKNLILIGFALETRGLLASARRKLKSKNLDLVVGNTPKSFSSGDIRPTWIERSGRIVRYPTMSKKYFAATLGRWIESRLNEGER